MAIQVDQGDVLEGMTTPIAPTVVHRARHARRGLPVAAALLALLAPRARPVAAEARARLVAAEARARRARQVHPLVVGHQQSAQPAHTVVTLVGREDDAEATQTAHTAVARRTRLAHLAQAVGLQSARPVPSGHSGRPDGSDTDSSYGGYLVQRATPAMLPGTSRTSTAATLARWKFRPPALTVVVRHRRLRRRALEQHEQQQP